MKNLVILSGAGMSAESGISTFRDAGGLWDKYPVEQVATPEGYARNPELVINFYNERRKQLLDVVPNAGHLGVADLERDFNVTVVTQNRQYARDTLAWGTDEGLFQPRPL